MISRRAAVWTALLALLASPAAADDGEAQLQHMTIVERGGRLELSTSLGSLFDSAAYEALENGFPTVVAVRILTQRVGGGSPLAAMAVQRTIVYDLWDEVYQMKFEDQGKPRTLTVRHRAEALRRATELEAIPIAAARLTSIGEVFEVEIIAELNPVSTEALAQVRRWLTQGGSLDRGGSFFGSFVSVFVNPQLAAADRVLHLRSQPFYRPARP